MGEKILNNKKNGMAVLLLSVLFYLAAVFGSIVGGITGNPFLIAISCVYLGVGWIFWLGLKVLKPQEALVLTLFGNYVGTIKEPGFYFVNPFCTAVNPAAKTRLNQSGDVNDGPKSLPAFLKGTAGASAEAEFTSKKISLKIMTPSRL